MHGTTNDTHQTTEKQYRKPAKQDNARTDTSEKVDTPRVLTYATSPYILYALTLILVMSETPTTTNLNFGETVAAMEDAKKVDAKYKVPLKEDKTSILLNVELGVKDLMGSIAKKEPIEGIDLDPSTYAEMPNSFTGVVMHLVVAGLKTELDIAFDNPPKSLKRKGSGSGGSKGGGRTKLSRSKKNEILERMDMKFYLNKLAAGTMTMDEITVAIKDAYKEKTEWEEKGWKLVEGKTKYPENLNEKKEGEELQDD